jgi:MFS family permease
MLLPFPLIQYPLGKLADKRYGEKEIMSIGFLILGISTIAMAFISSPNIAIWAIALFVSRIGAAATEIMMETYFFKTVSPRDSAVLGVFRITRPLSYFIAPLITIIGLMYTNDADLFIILGVICLLALIPTMTIKDTN